MKPTSPERSRKLTQKMFTIFYSLIQRLKFMCGIAGVIYRNPQDYQKLGADLLSLIRPLESRGFDSCGVGLFGNKIEPPLIKLF
ncbi:MAG: hypothetical protein HC820_04125 [Hydrococcus sp. RM1_1_31]|nr:hypothetical protein [Hydrococcus sp. RM1_1_31]